MISSGVKELVGNEPPSLSATYHSPARKLDGLHGLVWAVTYLPHTSRPMLIRLSDTQAIGPNCHGRSGGADSQSQAPPLLTSKSAAPAPRNDSAEAGQLLGLRALGCSSSCAVAIPTNGPHLPAGFLPAVLPGRHVPGSQPWVRTSSARRRRRRLHCPLRGRSRRRRGRWRA